MQIPPKNHGLYFKKHSKEKEEQLVFLRGFATYAKLK